MASTKSALDELIRGYKNKNSLNKPKTLYEYMLSRAKSPMSTYSAAMKEAANERAISGGGYGVEGERVAAAGLTASGYRRHLEELADARLKEREGAAKESAVAEYYEAKGEYESYLGAFAKKQESVKDRLRRYMTENSIVSPEETFSLGIENGLSADEAASLTEEIYRGLRNRVIQDCLVAISTAALDLNGIRSYAERSGLLPDDVAELVKEARRLAVDGSKYSDDYLDELENQANKH